MAKVQKRATKKQKPANKQSAANSKIEKKKLSQKKKLKKTLALLSSDSDSDSDGSLSHKLQKLLESYPKDQLISFLIDAAIADSSLLSRIGAAADHDVSHRKIFVHGLSWDTNRETLVSSFQAFGEIEDCNVIVDRATGKTKGYGFVLFKLRKGATKALKEPRKKIGNRMASCQLASVGSAAPAAATDTKDGVARKIYISNVPSDTDPEKLRAFFAKFGEIEFGPIGFDMQTGKSRGFALFVYKTVESAKMALQEPYKVFDGHKLRCQMATDGKNKAANGAATITTAVQPVQVPTPMLAAMVASQNMAMMNQQYQYPSLNPLYGGLVNPMMAAQGLVGSGQVGGYGPSVSGQVGNLGGGLGSSLLGAYGATGSGQMALQHAYPSSQLGQASSAGTPGATTGSSHTGYRNPSYK